MHSSRGCAIFAFLSVLFAGFTVHSLAQQATRAPGYAPVIAKLRAFIERQIAEKELPALSIALVDDQTTVWAAGFGYARPEQKITASDSTIYRVGSVSKLFTDIAIMQLVERGLVDLDSSITTYLPEFQPQNPFGKPITLRQLMSHRSGLVREPPIGNYFDAGGPSLEATVRSLNRTVLVYPPGTRTKYSNAGIAVVGYLLEHLQGRPFAAYMRDAVLKPMGLLDSDFELSARIRSRLATARMWSYDGREFPAPTFELGMAPAGNMYAPVTDLAKFLKVLFAGGVAPGGRVLHKETLESMWQPQFASTGSRSGYGIGFAISELAGLRRIGHGGAIYGFATQLDALPEAKLGVAAVTSMDVANDVVKRITTYALQLLLGYRNGEPLPEIQSTAPVSPELARKLNGRWRSREGEPIEFVERDGLLFLWRAGLRLQVRSLSPDTLVTDDRLGHGLKIAVLPDGRLQIARQVFEQLPDEKPAPAPPALLPFIGEYGWDHNVLFILEKEGRLHALIEWVFLYPLEVWGLDRFAFPNSGLYHGEHVVFERDVNGNVTAAVAAGIRFPRRQIGVGAAQTFRITPVRPVEEIRRDALRATPPSQPQDLLQPDLVELAQLDSTLRFDIRYATTNNFMGEVFYEQPRAFLQRPVAEALMRAHRSLIEKGYGLLIHDAYRPWYVTKMFWDATPDSLKDFVANPTTGSIHNRGAAVDLSLFDRRSGKPVEMVSGYDEFSARAFPDYAGGTALQRWHRELLRDAMEAQGFRVYRFEWWHFNHETARRYPILNLRFEQF